MIEITRQAPTKSRVIACIMLVCALWLGDGSYSHADEQNTLNKAQAVKIAQQKIKGRILKVEQYKNSYRVKMLQKTGRVISVDVDKRSGKVSTGKRKKKER